MLNKIFLTLAICSASFAYAYDYTVEIELKDGSVYEYDGSCRDSDFRMHEDHWGHDPADIERETFQIYPSGD